MSYFSSYTQEHICLSENCLGNLNLGNAESTCNELASYSGSVALTAVALCYGYTVKPPLELPVNPHLYLSLFISWIGIKFTPMLQVHVRVPSGHKLL